MLIPDWLVKHAAQFPRQIALVDLHSSRAVTYAQLNERASRFAEFLRERWQIKPGDRVAVLAHSSSDYVEMLYGCGKLGAIMVCLNWRLALGELTGIVADARPAAVIWGEEFDQIGTALAEACTLTRRMVTGAPRPGIAGYEAALAEMSGATLAMPWRQHDDVWYLLYTAGTTGKPKGVPQTWGMAFTNAVNGMLATGLRREDKMLSVLPYFHTGGLNLYLNPTIMCGGTTLIMRQFDVDQTMDLLEREATVMFGVPAIYLFLSQHPRFAGADFSRVRSWACGGAPIPKTLLEQYLAKGVTICFGFGMTETGPTAFLTDEATARQKVGTVGKPVMYVEGKIVDPATRELLGAKQRGELLLRGPGITPGYWQQPETTAKAFEDGWLCTGDIAYFDDDGDYYIVDRSKDMYISGGENVYPAEVENVIFQMEGVAEAAVIGVHDAKWGEVGKAIVALKPGVQATAEDVIAHCKGMLASFKAPRYVVFVPAVARNAAGKLDKPALRRQFGDAGQ
ncbi:MAG: long-chain fatty acid--CoA ligase [Rhodocyclales bacterium RIFCSPLOWO2_02_FULL_63_24]|nr:MAG: long-chain fatty acid--CoA ligase [Rhodocyclales bacterium RIFCSPLOWO2_02_FULL_63_24]